MMEKVRILADSTCDLSKELIEKYGIEIVPLNIILDEKSFFDGEDITPDDIYDWAEQNKRTPKTAAVGFDRMTAVVEKAKEEGVSLIAFSISSEMSTTFNVMRMVKEELEYDRMFIIDSGNLSTGIGLQVIRAAELAADGVSAEEIVKQIEETKDLVRASFVVKRLDYLAMGGRCSSVAALLGGTLKLKPRIEVSSGKMAAGKKYRGNQDKVILKYVQEMEEDLKAADPRRVFITHSGCPQELLDSVKAYLEQLNKFDEILITRAGGVISSHCGPETLGVLFYAQK